MRDLPGHRLPGSSDPRLRVVVELLLERSAVGAVSGMLQWRKRDDVRAVVSDLLSHLLFRQPRAFGGGSRVLGGAALSAVRETRLGIRTPRDVADRGCLVARDSAGAGLGYGVAGEPALAAGGDRAGCRDFLALGRLVADAGTAPTGGGASGVAGWGEKSGVQWARGDARVGLRRRMPGGAGAVGYPTGHAALRWRSGSRGWRDRPRTARGRGEARGALAGGGACPLRRGAPVRPGRVRVASSRRRLLTDVPEPRRAAASRDRLAAERGPVGMPTVEVAARRKDRRGTWCGRRNAGDRPRGTAARAASAACDDAPGARVASTQG